MINIDRNAPAPAELVNSSMIGVKEVLVKMQFDKCYLCENDRAGTYEIEHVKAKSLFPELEFVWENLLLACRHCNTIKSYSVDKDKAKQIIDCTDSGMIVKELIAFDCTANLKEKVEISSKEDDPSKEVISTVDLLNSIFNYSSESKMFDAKKLTDEVTIEVKKLLDCLHDLEFNAKTDSKRDSVMSDIENLLSIEAPFTAFKISYLQKHYAGDQRFEHLI